MSKRRIAESADGFTELMATLADAGDTLEAPIPVAIETRADCRSPRCGETGRKIYAIHPMAVARYVRAVAGIVIEVPDADVLRLLPVPAPIVAAVTVEVDDSTG
ncbi:hypothetical protein P3102_20165 [Amycolatopsis sp. QT-25]|uniref:hypothetical protein n=1 Tax=Amycolatopsis sp. QT-25 TaxID=3034022 RepID=UPI0023EB970C|nr:hypothetical protein [Amycolatopsis sp. QT-25]WET76444.1 hypothetical protein P3102_20165 [Amycolatopsis sp. QT-25]